MMTATDASKPMAITDDESPSAGPGRLLRPLAAIALSAAVHTAIREARASGKSFRQVAKEFGVSLASVQRAVEEQGAA